MKLLAIPYAAGSASMYRDLAQALDPRLTLCPVELSGHGQRLFEPLEESIQAMARALLPQLPQGEPWCLLGYSMGSQVAYELCQMLRQAGRPLPDRLILCAADIPTAPDDFGGIDAMSDSALVKELRRLGGTPPEILENEELLELVLPVVRADFRAVEIYKPSSTQPLSCPAAVIVGEEELREPGNQIGDWPRFFTGPTPIYSLPGGHFYIHDQTAALARLLGELLLREVRP